MKVKKVPTSGCNHLYRYDLLDYDGGSPLASLYPSVRIDTGLTTIGTHYVVSIDHELSIHSSMADAVSAILKSFGIPEHWRTNEMMCQLFFDAGYEL